MALTDALIYDILWVSEKLGGLRAFFFTPTLIPNRLL